LLGCLEHEISPLSVTRLSRLHGGPSPLTLSALKASETYGRAVRNIAAIGVESGDLLAGAVRIDEHGWRSA
jgi:hypothetical protein